MSETRRDLVLDRERAGGHQRRPLPAAVPHHGVERHRARGAARAIPGWRRRWTPVPRPSGAAGPPRTPSRAGKIARLGGKPRGWSTKGASTTSNQRRTAGKAMAASASMSGYGEPSPGNMKHTAPGPPRGSAVRNVLVGSHSRSGPDPASTPRAAASRVASLPSVVEATTARRCGASADSSSRWPAPPPRAGRRSPRAAGRTGAEPSRSAHRARRARRADGPGCGAASVPGTSSRMAWALMPPKPKALTPARRGCRPPPWIQGRVSVLR